MQALTPRECRDYEETLLNITRRDNSQSDLSIDIPAVSNSHPPPTTNILALQAFTLWDRSWNFSSATR